MQYEQYDTILRTIFHISQLHVPDRLKFIAEITTAATLSVYTALYYELLYCGHVMGAFVAITVTLEWAWWRLKSPASPLFAQLFIQATIKESMKAPRHWPLCGESTGDRWISSINGQ